MLRAGKEEPPGGRAGVLGTDICTEWGGMHLAPSVNLSMQRVLAHTWSLGTPSGTDPDFLSACFCCAVQALIQGTWQGIQSLLYAKHGYMCVRALSVTASLGMKILESEDRCEFESQFGHFLCDLGCGWGSLHPSEPVCPSAGEGQ